ncbi:serine hydrolase [Pseudoxanthomonas helianthi]|uniref:Serine hydrolase n=1 Tax=Pseudoxanthomonas helianthi TaxID=1453541 RepID=A0A940X526_9GAMM|nr:serine hydrolase domain-containing protein [Pseudoxanthomonas helianthi]MBP3985287.1 serine hydrolase [Pseudoxanthomonas helianthi]
MKCLVAALLLTFSIGVPRVAQAADEAPDAQAIDAAVRATIDRYKLPGIAVGVMEDGKVTFARGYGETVFGSGDPVTTKTLFKIASNSKAMTAAVLARLVQQGKLRWDDPVVKHLPGFAMHDPWVTRHMTVSDLLVHNSGLPEGGGDLMLWPEPNLFTRDDIVNGLRYIKPAYGFRAGYAYDNLLYVVAGQVAAAAGGASYEELLRREVFKPLALEGCRVGEFRLTDAGSVAQPHSRDGDKIVRTRGDAELVPEIASAPAGGIRCSLDDMLAWARNWLVPTDAQKQWLGDAQRAEMWKARTPMPVSQRQKRWDRTHYYAYAYGFRLADVDGEWTVSHTGTLGGMYSMMMLLPDRRSGFVFMINGDGSSARTVLGEALLKLFTAPEASLGVQGYADDLAKPPQPIAAAPAKAKLPDIARRKLVAAEALRDWLGTWRDPWFGEVRICATGKEVEWRSLKSPKMHGQIGRLDGRFLLVWDDEAVDENAWLDFARQGDVRTLRMAKFDPQGDFSSDYEDLALTRVGDCPTAKPGG